MLEAGIRKLRPARVLTCAIYKFALLENGQILSHFAENADPRP